MADTPAPPSPVSSQSATREKGYVLASEPSQWWLPPQREQTPELTWPASVDVFDRMRSQESQVSSVLRAVTHPIHRTTWRIEPNGARDEVVAHVAQDLGLQVRGRKDEPLPRTRDRFSWPDHLRMALLMLVFGHSVFEQVYRLDEASGLFHLRKLGPRMPWTIHKWNVARDGGLTSVEQKGASTGSGTVPRTVTLPVSRLVVYSHEREGGEWWGRSLLRSAYKDWLIKDRLLRVNAMSIARNGMGIPRYTGAPGETSLDKGLALAEQIRAGEEAGAAVPNGAELELMGVTGNVPSALPTIKYHDEQIARGVLAHFLNLGSQTGSWALGTTFADFFTQSLTAVAQAVATTGSQHIVEDLVDINWGPDEPAPVIVFDEIGSKTMAVAQAIKTLVDAGALTPDAALEAYLRANLGLPVAEDSEPPDVTEGIQE